MIARVLFAWLVLFCLPAYAAPEIGQPAPDFTATDTNGNPVTLSDYRGKIVVLEWSNHECPFVRKHYETGNMQALQKEATDDGVIWLTIVSSARDRQGYTTPEQANAIMKDVGSRATARILDPEGTLGRLYDARTTPHMFVIAPDGTLAYMGAIDDMPSPRHETVNGARNYVRMAIQSLKEGAPVNPATTRPYGCAVKYSIY